MNSLSQLTVIFLLTAIGCQAQSSAQPSARSAAGRSIQPPAGRSAADLSGRPAGSATKAADSATNAAALLRIEQQLVDGIPTGDAASWDRYLAPDFMIVNEDGSRTSRAAFISEIKPFPATISGHINILNPYFRFAGNVAIFNYVADEYEKYFGQSIHTSYAQTSIYQKKAKRWQLLNIQVFEIPQLPPAIRVPGATLQQYTGTYYLTPEITYTVTLEDQQLYGQRKGRDKEALLPETANIFFRKADTRGRKIFVKAEGDKYEMRERRNGQDIIWRQQP
jgi:hypothetical protein